MLKKIKNTFFSEYVKNITTLATGTFFAQFITFLFLIIISRIYTTEEFGLYSATNYFGGYRFIIFLLPLRILQLGLQQIFDELSIRNKFYLSLSLLRSSNSLFVSFLQIISRLIYKLDGLIIGKFIGDLIVLIILLLIHLKKRTIYFKKIT